MPSSLTRQVQFIAVYPPWNMGIDERRGGELVSRLAGCPELRLGETVGHHG
jgi:hypothetical protein